jgi:hypothetical protein
MTAAMIAAPAGAATGMLVSRFEANHFARQSVKTMTGNLGREAVEEGTQSLTGQLGTNTGLAVADNSIQPLEGAGDAAGEGAVLGSLTAGAVQSPGSLEPLLWALHGLELMLLSEPVNGLWIVSTRPKVSTTQRLLVC